jgi:hypothetical protein
MDFDFASELFLGAIVTGLRMGEGFESDLLRLVEDDGLGAD